MQCFSVKSCFRFNFVEVLLQGQRKIGIQRYTVIHLVQHARISSKYLYTVFLIRNIKSCTRNPIQQMLVHFIGAPNPRINAAADLLFRELLYCSALFDCLI